MEAGASSCKYKAPIVGPHLSLPVYPVVFQRNGASGMPSRRL